MYSTERTNTDTTHDEDDDAMASLNDRLKKMGVQDGGPGHSPVHPMGRQGSIAHPLEQTYGYSTCEVNRNRQA